MVAGNGGSAADAQHLAAEFVSRLVDDRPAMRAVALTTDTSILTAVGNDYGFERLFARQIEALGQPGDVFLAISTSGNSPNVLRALEQCRAHGHRHHRPHGKHRRQNAAALRLLPAHALRCHHVHPAGAPGSRAHLLACSSSAATLPRNQHRAAAKAESAWKPSFSPAASARGSPRAFDGLPKPMAPVAGRPFLEILLTQLQPRRLHPRSTLRRPSAHASFRTTSAHPSAACAIDYVIESVPLGTGGAIRLALAQAREESVLVLNGDTFLDADYAAMMRFHAAARRVSYASPSFISADITRYGGVTVEGQAHRRL